MANQRASDHDPSVYVDKGGPSVGGIIVGIAILALLAIVAFFLLQPSRHDEMRTEAVTSVASSMAAGDATAK